MIIAGGIDLSAGSVIAFSASICATFMVLLAPEAVREYGGAIPTTATPSELLTAARNLGLDLYHFAIVFDVLAAMAGVKGSVA